MVFRNIPEGEEEKSWADTTELLASKIASLVDVDTQVAKRMINRCHRGGNTTFYKSKNRIRPIYASMIRWDECEAIVKAAREQNAFYVDYKYGPLTTIRRNEALKMRKSMKRDGSIIKGFVKFPAVLMGLRVGGAKYEKIRDFSDDDVNTYKD